MNRTLPEPATAEQFNITPMIDVVFQLLIFFMLTTNMAQTPPDLRMPSATNAIEPAPDPLRITIDISRDGRVRMAGRLLFDPARETEAVRLERLFDGLRAQTARRHRWPLYVRADRSCEFQHLQRLLMIAAEHGGAATIELGATIE